MYFSLKIYIFLALPRGNDQPSSNENPYSTDLSSKYSFKKIKIRENWG